MGTCVRPCFAGYISTASCRRRTLENGIVCNCLLDDSELHGTIKRVANEAHFATGELSKAIVAKDAMRALDAWEYGKDSWNSYLNVVNPSIVPKVGDQFMLIE